MERYALEVISYEPGTYRWSILEPVDGLEFQAHSEAECDFRTYADALNAGTLALAKLEGKPCENEAADPVGNTDCSGEDAEASQPVTQQMVSR